MPDVIPQTIRTVYQAMLIDADGVRRVVRVPAKNFVHAIHTLLKLKPQEIVGCQKTDQIIAVDWKPQNERGLVPYKPIESRNWMWVRNGK